MNQNRGNISASEMSRARGHVQQGTQIRNFQRDQMEVTDPMRERWANQEQYTIAKPRAANTEAASKNIERRQLLSEHKGDYDGLADVGYHQVQEQRAKQLLAQQEYAANYGSGAQDPALQELTSLGKAYVGSEFFDYLDDQKKLAFLQQFEFFKMNMVDLTTPQGRSWWKKHQPELFERKLKYVRDQMALDARAKELQILGPENENDMRFLYHYTQGDFKRSTFSDVNEPLPLFTHERIEYGLDGLKPRENAIWAVEKKSVTPFGNTRTALP